MLRVAYVKVDILRCYYVHNAIGCIVRNLIVILFSLNILFVKRSGKKTVICLARVFFLNQVVIDSSRVCIGWVSVIYLLNSALFV